MTAPVPYSSETEKAVLGAILVNNSLDGALDLCLDDFSSAQNRRIFNACLSLHELAEKIDLVTVSERLNGNGDTPFIMRLASDTVTGANIRLHAKELKEEAFRRRVHQILNGVKNENIDDLYKNLEKLLSNSPSQFHGTYRGHEAVKLKLTTLGDIFSHEDPNYLINKILMENALILLTAYSGVGKSLLVLFLIHSVLTGKKLFDHFAVLKQGSVLIVDEENPGSFLKDRLSKIGFTQDMPLHFLHFQKVKLDRMDCFRELTHIINELKPTLVVFDALIRIHSQKENDADMAIVMERLRDIVNLGTTVVVIHHHRKGAGDKKEAVRGSSDILGGVDMSLSLEEKGDFLILSSPKSRMQPIEPVRLRLETDNNSLAFRFMGTEINENQAVTNEVVNILEGGVSLGVKEIMTELKDRNHEIGQNRLREILQGVSGRELQETTGERGKKIYSLSSTFTVSRKTLH